MKTDYLYVKRSIFNNLDKKKFGKVDYYIEMGYKDGIINLLNLEKCIEYKRRLRYEIINFLISEITSEFKKRKVDFKSVSLNVADIFKDNYLNLSIEFENQKMSNLIDLYGNMNYNYDIEYIYKILSKFVHILKNEQVYKLLDTSFYDEVIILLDNIYKVFCVSGSGINIYRDSNYMSQIKDFNILNDFYRENHYQILSNIEVYNNTCFDKYQTDLTRRKVISMYNRGRV